jgi:hypothetical protein
MSKDGKLKSAYELAMERLRAEDNRLGVDEPRPLSRRQKDVIHNLRQEAKAKLAELEILRDQRFAAVAGDPEKLAEEEQHYKVDRRRVEAQLETSIADIKQAGDGADSD